MTSRTALEAFLAEPRNVIVAGIRKDGRPHVSPNWFFWDGERFYVSTTRPRVKYKIFSRDPRVELVVDDATGHRYVALSGTVEILEDVKPNLGRFRAIREKHGREIPADDTLAADLIADDRVLLAVTPDTPQSDWTVVGLDLRAADGPWPAPGLPALAVVAHGRRGPVAGGAAVHVDVGAAPVHARVRPGAAVRAHGDRVA
jgi:PPOX class probable F420-dependent enzyme